MNKYIHFLLHPRKLLFSIGMYGWIRFMRDETYLRLMYWCKFGKRLDLQKPQTFNAKLQWLKLNYRDPSFIQMVDKYEAKKYVASLIGEKYIIPTLGEWESFEDIDFSKLPERFVLKCTHDSGGVVICNDKHNFDYIAAKKRIQKCLKRNYYWVGREWPYKNVQPRIIAEKHMVDDSNTELRDYKVLCFNGKAKLIEYHQNRYTKDHTQDMYDTNWKLTDIYQGPHSNNPVPKPACFDEMLQLSERLAEKVEHLRVDWYIVNGNLYFGELTLYDGAGFDAFDKKQDDLLLGSWIKCI